jgi:transposase-like protein
MTGSSWQRCKVRVKAKHSFQIDLNREDAQKQSKLFIQEYEARYPEAVRCLEEGLEDSLQFFHFNFIDHRGISSTNVLERLNREVRCRSRVVGISPRKESCLRLLTSYLMEYTEAWEVEKSYIQPQKLELAMIKREALL